MSNTDELQITKTCCHQEATTNKCHTHSCGCHDHIHAKSGVSQEKSEGYKAFIGPAISLGLLISGLIIDHVTGSFLTTSWWANPLWYFIAFLPVGNSVVKEAIKGIFEKDYFNELTLMSIACIGAFLIGEYSEAVGVMLFYSIGEILQEKAVDKATRDISKLLDVKAETARVLSNGEFITVKPEEVKVGDVIEVRPGERVPLDGTMLSDEGLFDTAALTGESVPRSISMGEEVLSGMIDTSSAVRIKVNKPFGESAISRILDLVKNAQEKKAKSEVFIRKFARIYTPIVTLFAVLVVVVPFFISLIFPDYNYIFTEWLYRALVFLVISCPCALVISVPLSYFAGIGAASKYGVLFKGGNYLEAITHINSIAFDKTGTLTTGEFSVDEVVSNDFEVDKLLSFMATAESESSHPLAKTLVKYVETQNIPFLPIEKMKELAGKGVEAEIEGHTVIAGNLKLLKELGISYPQELNSKAFTIVACGIDGKFVGYVVMSDTIKDDSEITIKNLSKLGIDKIVMLSGDRKEIVANYSGRIGLKEAYGELLPQEKAEYVEKVSKTPGRKIAFVGDGMNDAPVLALSNVGIAMGGLGSDAAIESADIVIQTDKPSRVVTAIEIGRYTHKIVTQNIVGALAIKIAILALGLVGIATLWAAVFADVGVTMLAVLNSMRIMWKKF